MTDDATPNAQRFSRDEQAFAVWLSHTVILVAVTGIALIGIGHVPLTFLLAEVAIWLIFTPLVRATEVPIAWLLRRFDRDEYLMDFEAIRRRALPVAFALAFVLQFVALTPLLIDSGGPIGSPFAAFVVAYAVFSSLLTTHTWSLAVTLVLPTGYYGAMVWAIGVGHLEDRPPVGVYVAVTWLILWLTVGLALLSRLPTWRMQTRINEQADLATLRAAVAAQIWTQPAVLTRRLPAQRRAAEAALAEYALDHPELALRIADGRRLEWVERVRMIRAQALKSDFKPASAASLLAESLAFVEQRPVAHAVADGDAALVGRLDEDPVLPRELYVRASVRHVDMSLLEETARVARQHAAGASIGVLLVPAAAAWLARQSARTAQRTLATSIIILDAERLLRIAGSAAPRQALSREVLQQADLSKTNVFTVRGPTPAAVFYGRGNEQATVTSALKDSSVALLGGRRTGKTSLLKRIEEALREEQWTVKYLDLQQVGEWQSFADAVSQQWNLEAPRAFSAIAIARIIDQVREIDDPGDKPLIIMFDEVDGLLDWDLTHAPPTVPEAFFRSCRALSQQGKAQFVLAGERVIAHRLWSPQSPHWNFCRPVRVRQLSRPDSDRLLVEPLKHLNVELLEPDAALDLVWSRTSGHAQIVQQIGKDLVLALNERAPDQRGTLSIKDVGRIVETAKFRTHYVTTYQGQATPLERTLCNLAAGGTLTVEELTAELRHRNFPQPDSLIRDALRMLDLYGIVSTDQDRLSFRAAWLPEALFQERRVGRVDDELGVA